MSYPSVNTHVLHRTARECYSLKQPFHHPEDEVMAKQLKRMNELYNLSASGDKSNEKELVKLERIFYPNEPDLYTSR